MTWLLTRGRVPYLCALLAATAWLGALAARVAVETTNASLDSRDPAKLATYERFKATFGSDEDLLSPSRTAASRRRGSACRSALRAHRAPRRRTAGPACQRAERRGRAARSGPLPAVLEGPEARAGARRSAAAPLSAFVSRDRRARSDRDRDRPRTALPRRASVRAQSR
jgi:hypothetical protein